MNLQQTEPVFYQRRIVPALIDSDNINRDITNVIDSWRSLVDIMRDAAIAEQVRRRRQESSRRSKMEKLHERQEEIRKTNTRKLRDPYNPPARQIELRRLYGNPDYVAGGFHKTRKSKSKSGKTRKVKRKD